MIAVITETKWRLGITSVCCGMKNKTSGISKKKSCLNHHLENNFLMNLSQWTPVHSSSGLHCPRVWGLPYSSSLLCSWPAPFPKAGYESLLRDKAFPQCLPETSSWRQKHNSSLGWDCGKFCCATCLQCWGGDFAGANQHIVITVASALCAAWCAGCCLLMGQDIFQRVCDSLLWILSVWRWACHISEVE